MNIRLITPAPPGSRKGNRVTALRWARMLRELDHRVKIDQTYRGQPCDLLIALHARRSFPSIQRFAREHPSLPLVVALTGTDLYADLRTHSSARRSLEFASRLIVLQPLAINELPKSVRAKARVIHQSAQRPARIGQANKHFFDVCVLGHLRPVKDPFRVAMATRLLPSDSRIRILHIGAALSPAMEARARTEAATNFRYRWLGELPRWKALKELARSRLMVLTSRMEGGANVISEAIAASVPIISSRIPGSIGLLGKEYPGYFPVGNTRALARQMRRAEDDGRFYRTLQARCRRLAPLVVPERERRAWTDILRELAVGRARTA